MKTIKELADLIEANPECEFVIDNDCWWINGKGGLEDQIASSDEYKCDGWYDTHGRCYGSGLAAAMVELLNRKGFKITAGAC